MNKVEIGFGIREAQDLPGYPSGRVGTFVFKFQVDGAVATKRSALIAAAFSRDEFLQQTRAAGISSRLQVINNPDGSRAPWIPTCYLDSCEFATVDGKPLLN